jgi:uncharacterized membrane protein YjgN (DUF898 family)
MRRMSPFIFSGNATEYFKIWIVNIFLTLITLGLYSPWAKVRKLRYLYGNTLLDDNCFAYLADPVRILKGRLVAVTALVLYYLAWDFYPDAGMVLLVVGVLLFPFALITATSFQMRNTGYRNIQFSFETAFKDFYRQLAIPLGIVLILTGIMYSIFDVDWIPKEENTANDIELEKHEFLTFFFFLALMPVIPYLDYIRSRFIVKHTQFGNLDADFEGSSWGFYKIYLLAFLVSILIIMLTVAIAMGSYYVLVFIVNTESAFWYTNKSYALIVLMIFYLLNFIALAFLKAKRTNLIYQKTSFGEGDNRMQLFSHLRTWPLSWIYISNTVSILISFGMLIPWAKIRATRYMASCIEIESRGFDSIYVIKQQDRSALGDEFLSAFDMDLGL